MPPAAKLTRIANRLRAARMAKGLTQGQAARAAGIDAATVSRLERGQFGVDLGTGKPRMSPPIAALRRLCAYYGVTAASVLSDDPPN